MITDANGMPVLQPLVDDASTATFNAAFAQIGSVVAGNAPGIKTYKWDNAAARSIQGGMTEGDLGYQRDNDTLWFYTGSKWMQHGVYASARGTVNTPSSGYATVTFPAGLFTVPPIITGLSIISVTSTSLALTAVQPGSLTKDQFRVTVFRYDGAAVEPAVVHWEATQSTSTSAAG